MSRVALIQRGVALTPGAGHYVRSHGTVALTVAETPSWRPLTSFTGTGSGRSVPFRIRGARWRIVYRISFAGTCTLIFFCDGPRAEIVRLPTPSTVDRFGMSEGDAQTAVERSGPGIYQVRIAPGSDTTRWSVQVADYY